MLFVAVGVGLGFVDAKDVVSDIDLVYQLRALFWCQK